MFIFIHNITILELYYYSCWLGNKYFFISQHELIIITRSTNRTKATTKGTNFPKQTISYLCRYLTNQTHDPVTMSLAARSQT